MRRLVEIKSRVVVGGGPISECGEEIEQVNIPPNLVTYSFLLHTHKPDPTSITHSSMYACVCPWVSIQVRVCVRMLCVLRAKEEEEVLEVADWECHYANDERRRRRGGQLHKMMVLTIFFPRIAYCSIDLLRYFMTHFSTKLSTAETWVFSMKPRWLRLSSAVERSWRSRAGLRRRKGGSLAGEDAQSHKPLPLFVTGLAAAHTTNLHIYYKGKERREGPFLSPFLSPPTILLFHPTDRPTDTSYFWQLAGKILLARREEREVRWPAKWA